MCDHDLDTIERLRERNKTLKDQLNAAERKLGVARDGFNTLRVLFGNMKATSESSALFQEHVDRVCREALREIGKGE